MEDTKGTSVHKSRSIQQFLVLKRGDSTTLERKRSESAKEKVSLLKHQRALKKEPHTRTRKSSESSESAKEKVSLLKHQGALKKEPHTQTRKSSESSESSESAKEEVWLLKH